ncbi:MAG: VWA domain-containing protein, partial [Myxococcales bacterium]|nr:VWA domain-containing protein [Myxococcales bacterium]
MPAANSESPVELRPRRRRRAFAPLLALASALGLVAALVSSCETEPVPKEAPALGASLELASGEVVLTTDDGEQALLSNTPLPIGAQLRTATGARALVRLGDGTRVFLRDDTSVVLDDGLELVSGQAWVEAPPLERGAQGTAHTVGAVSVSISDGGASLTRDGDDVEIYVAEGLAIVSTASGRSEVDPGERARVSGSEAPVVEPVKFWDDWTGGMGDIGVVADGAWVGTGSLYAIDHMAGATAQALSIQRQNVRVAIAEQIAETEVDQLFFNPAASDVEGYYWFTIPEDAMLVGFALEVDGELVEGEVVERRQAVARYEESIQRQVDPALLEWIDARTVRARIYPIPAVGTRRVVIRYQQLLSETEGKLRYRYPMAAPVGREAATIEEFALEVELRGDMAKQYVAATRSEAKIEGTELDHISMRRSGFTPRADFELELGRREEQEKKRPPALRVDRLTPGSDQADYVMLRWLPDEHLDLSQAPVPKGEVVVVVDTSAGGDSSEHQAKLAVAEALLRSLSADDRFALVAADLGTEVLFPEQDLAEATPDAISSALARVAERGAGGATDLGLAFERAIDRVHGLEQPAIIYVGDGQATSGAVGGEAMTEQLQRAMAGSRARLFTVAVGREVDEALLTKLAEIGGGKSLRVEDPSQAVVQALALSGALKTPTIVDLEVDMGEGMSQVFANASGKLSRGEELVILARTHDDLPETITITGHFAGEDFSQTFAAKAKADESIRRYVINHDGLVPRLVPRLWARAYVDSLLADPRGLEAVRGKVISLGYDYDLMTPFTSFLALENERAYAEAGIER